MKFYWIMQEEKWEFITFSFNQRHTPRCGGGVDGGFSDSTTETLRTRTARIISK